MKKLVAVLMFLSTFLVGCSSNSNLTVMSYNIHYGGGIDKKFDLDRIAKVISQQKPDIVSLNEVDCFFKRSQCINETKYLAEKTGMNYAFGPNLVINSQCQHCTKGLFGNAILTKHKILSTHNHTLYKKADEEVRGCLETVLEIEGKQIAVLSTHLDCHREEDIRNTQADDILEIIKGKDMPAILMGDMNAYIRSDENGIVENAAKILTTELYDAANSNPQQKEIRTLQKGKRIDFILVTDELKNAVCDYQVINYGDALLASDHFPIIAKIKK